jgi:hypothetical protein
MKPPPMQSREPPHIITCLGWTQERVNKLFQDDLRNCRAQRTLAAATQEKAKQGGALVLQSPVERLIERLPEPELQALVGLIQRPAQMVVLPWSVDLTGLSIYGYKADEIRVFEDRMYAVAAKRMKSLDPSGATGYAEPT